MSDIFDHDFDAFDAEMTEDSWSVLFPEWSKINPPKNGKYRINTSVYDNYWVCKRCGRKHPVSHKDCYWCYPTGY